MIIAGTGLCLANVGVDSLDDLFNPYYWADAAPSIMGGIWPGGYVGNFVKTAIKLRSIGQPFKIREKLAIRSGIVGAAPTGMDDYLGSIVSGKIISDTLKYFLRNIMHYPEGSYHPSKIRRLIGMIYILDIMFEIFLLFLAILPYIVLFMFLIKKCVLFMERILNIKLLQEAPAEFDNVLFSGPDSFVHDPEMTSNYFLLAGSSFIISFIIGFCSNYMLNSEFYNLLGFAMLFLALAYALVIAGLRGNIFSYYGLS